MYCPSIQTPESLSASVAAENFSAPMTWLSALIVVWTNREAQHNKRPIIPISFGACMVIHLLYIFSTSGLLEPLFVLLVVHLTLRQYSGCVTSYYRWASLTYGQEDDR